MNFTKTLLAVALLASAGAANASGTIKTGDLLLDVIDTTNKSSYTLDLGVTTNAFLANPVLSVSVNDANFLAFVAGQTAGDTVTYNVQGEDAINSPIIVSTFTTSSAAAFDGPGGSLFPTDPANYVGNSNLALAATTLDQLSGVANAHATGLSNFSAAGGGTGYVGGFGVNNKSTEGTLSNQVAVGTAINFWSVDGTDVNGVGAVVVTQLGSVKFSQQTGILTLTATAAGGTSAVPLPTSVWMFLSGIVGLLSMKRRSNAAA